MLSAAARRPLAAAWFGFFGFLASSLFFLRPGIKLPALCLYVLAPAIAATLAGSFWGAAILDPTKTQTPGAAMLRGLGVTAGAFAIFAVLYALGLPLLERGWKMSQAGGILVAALTLGLVMVGPLIAISGMLAGLTLFLLGRRATVAPGDQASNHPAV